MPVEKLCTGCDGHIRGTGTGRVTAPSFHIWPATCTWHARDIGRSLSVFFIYSADSSLRDSLSFSFHHVDNGSGGSDLATLEEEELEGLSRDTRNYF